MTDIVERLRTSAQFFQGSCEWPATADAFAEAAAEIERLRKLVAATERDLEKALAALDHHLKADK